jgi:hypothetical protein
MKKAFALTLLMTAFVFLACGGGSASSSTPPPTQASNPPSVERDVLPSATDPAIDTFSDAATSLLHVAINPSVSVAPKNKLFVFLPGSGSNPTRYRLILRTGASQGYHCIGLMYPNNPSVDSLCGGSTDVDCWTKVRSEIITGTDTTALVSVNRANSLENRLIKALQYLNAQFPTEGWGQFLSSGNIAWNLIHAAGHSQGGGHAAFLAKYHDMARVSYFASPGDYDSVRARPAAWYDLPNVTAASKMFGFVHQQDTLVTPTLAQTTWTYLGMSGTSFVTVENSAPPYGNSQRLTTNLIPQSTAPPSPYHSATIADPYVPLEADNLTPKYRAAWIYMCFP